MCMVSALLNRNMTVHRTGICWAFMPPEHSEKVRAIFQNYALQTDGDEPGALKHRFTAIAINKSKGSAVGYIPKIYLKDIGWLRPGMTLTATEYRKRLNE